MNGRGEAKCFVGPDPVVNLPIGLDLVHQILAGRRVAVRSKTDEQCLWEELSSGQAAFDLAREMAAQIHRIGIEDFLFKKEHGWRID